MSYAGVSDRLAAAPGRQPWGNPDDSRTRTRTTSRETVGARRTSAPARTPGLSTRVRLCRAESPDNSGSLGCLLPRAENSLFQHDRLDAFECGIDGGGKTGRSCSDDHDFAFVEVAAGTAADCLDDLSGRRFDDRSSWRIMTGRCDASKLLLSSRWRPCSLPTVRKLHETCTWASSSRSS